MAINLHNFIILLAAVLAFLAALNVPSPPRFHFGWCAIFLLIVSQFAI